MTDPELTVLTIAAAGQELLSVGNWREAILALAARGFMRATAARYADPDTRWYRITDAGHAALEEAEEAELRGVIRERDARVKDVSSVVIEGEP
jgi:DNA-binding PadR family transcriptional regulator